MQNIAIQIRLATPNDIPEISRLIPESVRALGANYYDAQQIESALVHVFGVDTQLIDDGTYLVAVVDNEIAGCGGWSRRETLYGGDQAKSEADPLLDPTRDPARIRAFFVHPRWARRGIGRMIINACEEAARKAGFRKLELVATLPGEPLYAATGYEVIERFEIDLPDGVKLTVARMQKQMS
ncbi:MAG TPA: GNAT family N-acetyltransferase [Blastocatellia bacterium]|nr:GNAT family N-acetyltransferase [Blastocatellia bacterium]